MKHCKGKKYPRFFMTNPNKINPGFLKEDLTIIKNKKTVYIKRNGIIFNCKSWTESHVKKWIKKEKIIEISEYEAALL